MPLLVRSDDLMQGRRVLQRERADQEGRMVGSGVAGDGQAVMTKRLYSRTRTLESAEIGSLKLRPQSRQV
jgi:hypothetical protein